MPLGTCSRYFELLSLQATPYYQHKCYPSDVVKGTSSCLPCRTVTTAGKETRSTNSRHRDQGYDLNKSKEQFSKLGKLGFHFFLLQYGSRKIPWGSGSGFLRGRPVHNTKRLKLLRSLAWLANFKLCRLLRTYVPRWATIRCCWSSLGRIYCTLHSLICRWWVFCAAVTHNGTLEIIAGSEWDFVQRLPEDFNTKPVVVLGWSYNFSRRSAEVAGKADIIVKGDPYLTVHHELYQPG